VQWPPGISIEKVAAGLLHPVAGLTGAYVSQTFGSQISLGVSDMYKAASAHRRHVGPIKLLLRADDPPSPEGSSIQQPWQACPPFPEWVAWQAVYGRSYS
jgi:hypothetical protein